MSGKASKKDTGIPDDIDITDLLQRWSEGDEDAEGILVPVVYERLRSLAGKHLRRESPGHILNPTDLAHEVYLQLLGPSERMVFEGRKHFFCLVSRVMRNLLVSHARKEKSRKRGGSRVQVTLDENLSEEGPTTEDALALHEALEGLGEISQRAARVVELRFFAGLTLAEVAQALGTGRSTVKRDWLFSKRWLSHQISRGKR